MSFVVPQQSPNTQQQYNILDLSCRGGGGGLQLPSKIHYHSRQNSTQDLSNLLIWNSKATETTNNIQNSHNNNNLYEYTDSNYNPLQDSPFINFSQLDHSPDHNIHSINNSQKQFTPSYDPIYKGQSYQLKLDSSNKQQNSKIVDVSNQVKESASKKNTILPPNLNKETLHYQVQSNSISPKSIKSPLQQNSQYFSVAKKDEQNLYDVERKILQFDENPSLHNKKITQIRSPILTQKFKPIIELNQNSSKQPQYEYPEKNNRIENSNGKGIQIQTQTFEDTPEIIKKNKITNVQPLYATSYNEQISLNRPGSLHLTSPINTLNSHSQSYNICNIQKSSNTIIKPQNNQSNTEVFSSPFQDKEISLDKQIQVQMTQKDGENNLKSSYDQDKQYNYNQSANRSFEKKQNQQEINLKLLMNVKKNYQPSISQNSQSHKHDTTHNINQNNNNNLQENKYSNFFQPKSRNQNQIEEQGEIQYHNIQNNRNANIQEESRKMQSVDQADYKMKFSPINQSIHSNIDLSFQQYHNLYPKLIEFPQKKREILEQQRILIQKERLLLEKEKELIEQEEEIFYEKNQGQLNSNSPSRQTNKSFPPKEIQNYYQASNQNHNLDNPQKNISQFQHQFIFNQQPIQPQLQQSLKQSDYNLHDISYDKKIRESQQIESDFQQKHNKDLQDAKIKQVNPIINEQKQQQHTNIQAMKQNVYSYTSNSLKNSNYGSLQTEPKINRFQQEQKDFEKNREAIEQSFMKNPIQVDNRNQAEGITDYFKNDKTSNLPQSQQSKNKIATFPFSMKKKISEQNKQPQITSQSPEKEYEEEGQDEKSIVIQLVTPQKRETTQKNCTLIPSSQNQSYTDHQQLSPNLNAYLIKKQKIFSPNHPRYHTPQPSFLSSEKLYKIEHNKQELGIQVNENSFLDNRSSMIMVNRIQKQNNKNNKDDKNSPKNMSLKRKSTDKSPLTTPQKKYHFIENNSQPNQFKTITLYQNNQLNQSESSPQEMSHQKQSIEYINFPSSQKKQTNDFLCFGCGDTQMSTENHIHLNTFPDKIESQQQTNYGQIKYAQPVIQSHEQAPYQQPPNQEIKNTKIYQQQLPLPLQSIQSAPINSMIFPDKNLSHDEQMIPTFSHDQNLSPSFSKNKDELIKKSAASKKIFQSKPKNQMNLKAEIQSNIEKIGFDPNDYKHQNDSQINSSFYKQNNKNQIIQNAQINSNSNNLSILNSSPIIQQQNQDLSNNELDFSYLNISQNGLLQNNQDVYCQKCLEFISSSRFDTHSLLCNELDNFNLLECQKQIEIINSKILKVAYIVKRKNVNASPLRSTQLVEQNKITSAFKNPQNSMIHINNKLSSYGIYLNECLCKLSDKNLSYKNLLSLKQDLILINQRLNSLKDSSNMIYYGLKGLEIVEIKQKLINSLTI